ncbi:putative redox protein, regulator of disulfide bond formation [Pseudarthrobacter phenanthrenivorans Sphe3]|uniref:Putative redox protein, regulator of disulfide bond formation n=1 Tax=Pseudarthrobacter phenanthrenivorans (strain DSM 18606 / JCM 16027 / LMG 23796 / Sphe3) TaxID=930171 RepID=F0MC03_PSEPM|nr:OsmC family protein [Pseudarthrobacter phenanthrenivorans]ADX74144.1 putative redox protein, regulator of disulfide bond formation [Pseudarthrobacter phenanthrenivorans Sphe3]
MTETTTRHNGIDVDGLMATIGAVKANPALGSFTFKATSTWRGGTRNSGVIRGFTQAGQPDQSRTEDFRLEGDEPPVLLGSNAGPNAVELLLQALGFCYAVGYAANAAAQGIELTALDFDVEGDLDVGPFLGLDGPRPGFTAIRATARVSSPNATQEQLQALCRYVQKTSPVRDCLVNPVPVETTLHIR